MRTITACPGIGDNIFLFQKLINQPEKFHWRISSGSPQRGHQIFELLPQLTESFQYIPDAGYNKVKRHSYKGKWAKAPQNFYLEANSHLETGARIEQFLPDLKTSYVLPYVTSEEAKNTATILKGWTVKTIGIYTSAYSNARHWGGWYAKEWLELIGLIQKHDPSYKFVVIGADYDIGIPEEIMAALKPEDYINTIGQPLPVVLEILKRLDLFIGFPSGLSILNETIGAKKTLMWYPQHLERLINSWPDPERIKNKQYKGCIFCEPEKIFTWMTQNWKDL